MGKMKSQEQWQQIFAEQKASGLTIVDYCRQHQLSTSNFYMRRKLLAENETSFVQAKLTQQIEFVSQGEPLIVNIGKATVTLPGTTSPAYLVQLLQELA